MEADYPMLLDLLNLSMVTVQIHGLNPLIYLTHVFEQLAMQALHIVVQATKRKTIRNIAGYFDGVYRNLIDKALFADIFMEYDMPVEGLLY